MTFLSLTSSKHQRQKQHDRQKSDSHSHPHTSQSCNLDLWPSGLHSCKETQIRPHSHSSPHSSSPSHPVPAKNSFPIASDNINPKFNEYIPPIIPEYRRRYVMLHRIGEWDSNSCWRILFLPPGAQQLHHYSKMHLYFRISFPSRASPTAFISICGTSISITMGLLWTVHNPHHPCPQAALYFGHNTV